MFSISGPNENEMALVIATQLEHAGLEVETDAIEMDGIYAFKPYKLGVENTCRIRFVRDTITGQAENLIDEDLLEGLLILATQNGPTEAVWNLLRSLQVPGMTLNQDDNSSQHGSVNLCQIIHKHENPCGIECAELVPTAGDIVDMVSDIHLFFHKVAPREYEQARQEIHAQMKSQLNFDSFRKCRKYCWGVCGDRSRSEWDDKP